MPTDPVSIVRTSFQAYIDKDRAALEAVIGPDFHFTSPLDNRIDRQTYFKRCWPNSETISGFDLVRTIQEGDQVIVTYEGQTITGKRFRNTEAMTVRDGVIVEVEVYFGWSLPHRAQPGGFVDP